MGNLSFLIVDGNMAERRERHRTAFGAIPGDAYGGALMALAPPGSRYDICFPADPGANLPTSAGLADYDGVVLTGSALHLWHREPAVLAQIDLARAIYKSRVPFFGSCWGIQIGAVAAGGDVRKNPKGREIGFARNIALSDAGLAHPLLAGRPRAFDAPAIHLDVIATPPSDALVLATNAYSDFQAMEIRHDGGTFWGVQYHPEFSLTEVATILEGMAPLMVEEGHARSAEDTHRWCADLRALDADRSRRDIAWRLGLDAEVLDDSRRTRELSNWLEARVKPESSARGRA
jgi:GMP synthase (glutamine-hydrolysing)